VTNNRAMASNLQGRVPERLRKGMRTAEDYHEYFQSRVTRRQILKGIGLAGAAVAAGPILWQRPGFAAEPPSGIHLAYGTDPARQMNVSWFTKTNVKGAVLDVGDSPAYGLSIPADSLTYVNKVDPPTSIQHHVSIPGLEAGKTYHYRVRHAGSASEDLTFTTAPDKIVPFRFTCFGDHGSDPGTDPGRASSGTAFSPRAVDAIVRADPAFHLHCGDIAYATGGPQRIWDVWHEEVQRQAALKPWMVTLGNHEMELGFGADAYDPFRSRFRLPSNGIDWSEQRTSTFYAMRHSNVLIVALDGNEAASEVGYQFNRGRLKGRQDAWLHATLKAARKDPLIDWIVVSFHNCMYCTDVLHGSDGGCRQRWQKIFEKYEVDLVLNGHNHCYERAYPIRGSEHHRLLPGEPIDPVTMGVTYVCAGGGGQLSLPRAGPTFPIAIVHNPQGEREFEVADWRAARFDTHSVAVLDVDPGTPGGKTTLTVSVREFVTPAGAEVDRFTFERPARAIAAPRVAGNTTKRPPRPPAPRPDRLPATGVGLEHLVAGAALLGGAAALGRAVADE
jgi:purple acid phosphatase-like protein/calcineurin-like phosphoesterase family protein